MNSRTKIVSEDCSYIAALSVMAGIEIMEVYNSSSFNVQEKTENGFKSPLTDADLKANSLIMAGLKSISSLPIVSEECKDDKKRLLSDKVWIVDPLDGTKEFIKRNGEFTVNIALVKDHRPVISAVYAPVLKKLYFAEAGKGSFLLKLGENSLARLSACITRGDFSKSSDDYELFFERLSSAFRLSVSEKTEIPEMAAVRSRSHAKPSLQRVLDNFSEVIVSGSSIKGCLIAEAKADFYPRLGFVNEWDICAMDLIVEEAGGILTDRNCRRIRYNARDEMLLKEFFVSNNKIHKELIELCIKSS